ncbi:MAG: hypothetical protein N2D54_07905, partial [Chloroflexota bacterium]
MTDIAEKYSSLPPEYQQVILRAEEQHKITIKPLQELVGGWSGAIIYLVSATEQGSNNIQHMVLKLDHSNEKSSSDETARHKSVLTKSPGAFAKAHIPDMVYESVRHENAMVIFYAIAGQSLHDFQTLSKYSQKNQLETLFSETNKTLLDVWNIDRKFEQFEHPKDLLQKWLGFRLNEGQKIEEFVKEECGIDPDSPGFIIDGNIFPNPLYYARNINGWDQARPLDICIGFQHSDLNINNILAKFDSAGEILKGYFLIDFALYKENMPLLYDHRYLEISYLVHTLEHGSFNKLIKFMVNISKYGGDEQVPIEMIGVQAVMGTARQGFENWLEKKYPSLQDDLLGQYWLAGTAAGLSFAHKAGQTTEVRLAGLIYAAVNLKQFFNIFKIPLPTEASHLFTAG